MMNVKRRVFVDMDGTICEYNKDDYIEVAARKGYYANRPPMKEMLSAVKQLITNGDFDIFILSAVFQDNHSKNDKIIWLNKYLPEINEDRMIFTVCGEKKSDFITNQTETDVLIDDFSLNLHDWHGKAIKVYNGINGTHGTWDGYSVRASQREDILANQLTAIIGI